jgi:hypothetical protein
MLVTVGCVRVRERPNCTRTANKKAQKAQMICRKRLGFPLRHCAFAGEILFRVSSLLIVLLYFASLLHAQNRLTISIPTPGEVRIEVEHAPTQTWLFRNAYANRLGLGERVDQFRTFEDTGLEIIAQKIATGGFQTELPASKISYSVKLSTPVANGLNHVSWLADDRGYLMLADLVPTNFERYSVRFNLPNGWSVESSNARDESGAFQVTDPVSPVFFVGRSLRKVSGKLEGAEFDVVLSGKWSFKDTDALKAASKVMERYLSMTQFKLTGKSTIMIAAPPIPAKKNQWWAETRGLTVALLIDPKGDKLQEHLKIIFSHELLHLWVPNSLMFDGAYDWFFEGFTMYMALHTVLDLEVIKFKGFLETLAGAYHSYLSQPDDWSLLEASERRWTTGGSQVYVKGMLVAFLYDLTLRKESGGRITLADRYRELFDVRGAEHARGNEVIIKVLNSSPAMADFTKSYIENAQKLELEQLLPAYGLQLEMNAKGSQLRVSRELSPEQRQLLRSLGY